MKRRNFGTNALQLAMAFILIFFGVILQTSGKDTVKNISLVLMLVPGIAMVIGFVMNYFTYPYYWSFPVILFSVVTMIVVDGLAALMGTLFHLLHADIIR